MLEECHERLSRGPWVAVGKACQLTWCFQKRTEPPASGRKENLFLREKESREGKEGAEMAGEGGEAAGNCRTQHNLSH